MSMTGEGVQALIAQGLGVAAQNIGIPYTQYRPVAGALVNPLVPANQIGTIQALFTQPAGMTPKKWVPQPTKDTPWWNFIADFSAIQDGDYLVGDYTYLVVVMQTLTMPLALRCREAITINRQTQSTAVGAIGYEALQPGQTQVIVSDLPASVQLQKTIGKNPVDLPGDPIRLGNWIVICQTSATILDRDIITTQDGRRLVVNAAWRSHLDWQLFCEVLEA